FVVGALVFLGGFGIADADAEQEPAGMVVGDPAPGLRDFAGVCGPHVDDSGGDTDPAGRVEQLLRKGKVPVRRATDPDGPVTEPFDLGCQFGGESVRVPPDSYPTKFDLHTA